MQIDRKKEQKKSLVLIQSIIVDVFRIRIYMALSGNLLKDYTYTLN